MRKARNATETEAPEDCDPKLLWTKDLPKAARNFNQASRFEALERVKSILSDQTCKAWFLSGGDEGAAWLLAGKGAMLTDAEFQALLRVRIMIPATDRTPYAGSCKHCANGQQGSLGLHVLHCQGANMHHQGGARTGIGQDAIETLKQPSIGHSLASSRKRPSPQVHWTLTSRERRTTGASKKE